jgi:hypothetical protein
MKDLTILNTRLGHIRFTCSNGYQVSIGIGSGHYCDNLKWNGEHGPTKTMEVAIMCPDNHFVVLPYDVAGHVPVSNLGSIISCVENSDWGYLCFLCGEDATDPNNKFPLKEKENV